MDFDEQRTEQERQAMQHADELVKAHGGSVGKAAHALMAELKRPDLEPDSLAQHMRTANELADRLDLNTTKLDLERAVRNAAKAAQSGAAR